MVARDVAVMAVSVFRPVTDTGFLCSLLAGVNNFANIGGLVCSSLLPFTHLLILPGLWPERLGQLLRQLTA